jgi:hypothetical protein
MSTALTAAQQAAVAAAGAQPRTLIDFDTAHGVQRVATELLRWSGLEYAGQLAAPPVLDVPLGSTGTGQLAAKSITVTLHNADGFWSRRPSSYYRGRTLTAREVLLDVTSDALRTSTFRVTATRMPPGGTTFVLEGEELWAVSRRQLVPAASCLFSAAKYPQMGRDIDELPGAGSVIPVPFGRSLVPLRLVDDQTSGFWRYAVCVGTATTATSFGFWEPSPLGYGLVPVVDVSGSPIGVYSLVAATRDGVFVTELTTNISPLPSGGGGYVQRFLDVVANSPGHPDQVLLLLTSDPVCGAGLPSTVIDSAGLAAARAFYEANSWTFDGALTVQRPLEDWLGDWTHDAMTAILARDKLVLQHQGSRSAQGSFHAGNIVRGSVTYADGPEGQEDSRRDLWYADRALDPSSAARLVSWNAGSGATTARVSPFIGRASVAAKAVQFAAKDAALGIRAYGLQTTVRMAGLEEGDVATLTHTLADADTGQLAVVTGMSRADGVYDIGLRRTDPSVWVWQDIPTDVAFAAGIFLSVPITYTGSGIGTTVFSSTHALGQLPTKVAPQFAGTFKWYVSASMTTATASNLQIAMSGPPGVQLQATLGGAVSGFLVTGPSGQ